jgi:hypothetical protein
MAALAVCLQFNEVTFYFVQMCGPRQPSLQEMHDYFVC